MTSTPVPSGSLASTPASARSGSRLRHRAVLGLLAFGGLSAVGGGIALMAGSDLVPLRVLEPTVFHTFFWPGVLLAFVVGGVWLASLVAVALRSRFEIEATALAGATMTVWIAAEVAQLRGVAWLHAVYFALGLVVLGLGLTDALRSRDPRRRWVLTVTGAEALGVMFPLTAGAVAARAGLQGLALGAVVVVAGAFEGLSLGTGQAWALPVPVSKWRYAALTALGALVAWAAIFGAIALGRRAELSVTGAVLLSLVGLVAIAGSQWLELRRHAPYAHRWLGWTMLAWVVALPLSFAGSPLIDEATPMAAQLTLLACGGLAMAHVMALITWHGVRRIAPPDAEG